MKRLIKRIICIAVLITTFVISLNINNAKAAELSDIGITKKFSTVMKNQSYNCTIQTSKDFRSFIIYMENSITKDIKKYTYINGIYTTYEMKSRNILGHKFEYARKISTVDFRPSIVKANETFKAEAYSSVTECVIPTLNGNHLWYQMGQSGSDVGYMKMGCVASYRIKADACSDCSTFRSKLLESNNLVAASGISGVGVVIVAVAILTAGVTGGLSLATGFGLEGAAYTTFVAACYAEQAAHDSYDIAKQYGTQL